MVTREALDYLTVEHALAILGKLDWYWCGEGLYSGKVFKGQGPPDLWPWFVALLGGSA